jgi:hypothetical protein
MPKQSTSPSKELPIRTSKIMHHSLHAVRQLWQAKKNNSPSGERNRTKKQQLSA